jgi:hypothetical protein
MRCTLVIALVIILAAQADAWHHEGHHLIALAAVRALPDKPGGVPRFFRDGAATIAHLSIDPDMMRNPAAPRLSASIAPEHYIDVELLQGRKPPKLRSQYVRMLGELKVAPDQAGFLPYALTEWTEALTIAFAEHRKWPDNPHIRIKCLVYAGYLAHYAGDLHQPLHTTIHFNGRAVDGKSPNSGIHAKVDDLLHRFKLDDIEVDREKLRGFDDAFASVLAEIDASHKLVDKVYELEPLLPGVKQKVELDPKVRAFALERAAASTKLTATLMLTAWEKSAKVVIPAYMDRAAQDGEASRLD